MSLETSLSKAVFQGNGASVDFPFAFRVWDAAELAVMVTGPDGLTRDVSAQCAVTLSESGGVVRYAPGGSPLPAGHSLVILRDMPFAQEIRLVSGARFDPAVIEEALDRAAAERQQLLEKVNRAVVVPAEAADPPEELAERIFEARDRAESAAAGAAASQTEAGREADRARAEADRAGAEADRAAQCATLGAGAANLEAVWTLKTDMAAGETLDLPVTYFPGRNMLRLGYDGVELYRGPQYEEIGDPDARSSAVRMLIPLARGAVMRAWAVASNVARHVEEAERRANGQADRAAGEADRAEREADKAGTARNVAQNAALEATEQAGRADDAAVDARRHEEVAGKYRHEAMEAAKRAAASVRGRSLAAVRSADLLAGVPSGFFVVNGDMVPPGTVPQPLTPVDSVALIPNMDGFFLFVPPFESDCPPRPEEPDTPDNVPDWTLPCGRRARI